MLLTTSVHAVEVRVDVYGADCNSGFGYAIATATNGTPPYTYSWSDGSTDPEASLPLGQGYTVTVTDNTGSSASQTFDIYQGASTISFQDLYFPGLEPCQGECNGGFRLYLPRIVGGYTFDISPTMQVQESFAFSPQAVEYYMRYEILGACAGANVDLTVYSNCGSGSTTVAIPAPIAAPTVTVIQISGSCTNSSNGYIAGSVSWTDPFLLNGWQMEAVDALGAVLPGQSFYFSGTTGDPFELYGLHPGAWDLRFSSTEEDGSIQSPCVVEFPFVVPDLGTACGALSGKAFVDADENCLQGTGEPNLTQTVVVAQPGNHYALTNGAGQYNMSLPFGTYTVTTSSAVYQEHCGVSATPFTVSVGQPNVVRNLADTSLVGLDVMVSAASGAARPGFPMNMNVLLRNLTGVLAGNATVTLTYDPVLTYVSATPPPTSINGNTLTWNSANLGALQQRSFNVSFAVPPDVGLLGTTLTSTVSASVVNPEANLLNNTFLHQRTVTGAYDPNDKTARTSSRQSTDLYFIEGDDWIDYTIRFQNTGTDTAFFVVITDTLPPTLDPATFLNGAASHTHTVSLSGQGVLRWIFPVIQLPDSNINEPRSHGFVSFRIKPREPLLPATMIENVANIYFDFNPPVITEPSILTVASPGVAISPRVLLGGPYVQATQRMSDGLRTTGLIPIIEPYTTLGYDHVGGGGESSSAAVFSVTGDNAIVDWVVVELRSTMAPYPVVATKSALLQRDGDVVAASGSGPVLLYSSAGNYRVAIRHRNHLGAMTNTARALSATSVTVDFSTAGTITYGTNARATVGTRRVLWAGDCQSDGELKYTGANNDRDLILVEIGGVVPTGTTTGYMREDVNMDGTVRYTGTNNDRDHILMNIGGTVPTNVVFEQLP